MAAEWLGGRLHRSWSVRARTTAATALILGVTLSVGAVVVLVLLRRTLIHNVDEANEARNADITRLVASDPATVVQVNPGANDSIVQVVDEDGVVVASSANVRAVGRLTTVRPAGTDVETLTLTLPGPGPRAEEFRVAAHRAASPAGPTTVYVASSLEDVDETVVRVAWGVAVGVPMAVLVVAGVAWIVTGRALRPVEDIRMAVAEVSERSLARRVPVPNSRDEISRLASTMNTMLDRLDDSSDRQRRFVADASHELKTPLTSLRVDLEIGLAHPGTTNWPSVATGLLRVSGGMERLVDNLLYLARSDDQAPRRPGVPVDLDAIVAAEASRLRSEGTLLIDASGVSAATVLGRPDDLTRLVRNLLDNSARFARTRVDLTTTRTSDSVRLVVRDDGPGIPADQHERIFARFTQLDQARTRVRGHGNGLGLAIVRDIVQSHEGSVVIGPGPGAEFIVSLPSA